MSTLRVFNLTDVATPALVQQGLVDKTLAIYDILLNPGEEAELEESPLALRDAKHYESIGALAIGSLPSSYVVGKGRVGVQPAPVVTKTSRRKKGR